MNTIYPILALLLWSSGCFIAGLIWRNLNNENKDIKHEDEAKYWQGYRAGFDEGVIEALDIAGRNEVSNAWKK